MESFDKYVRTVPDFPKPGVLFYDITTLVRDPAAFAATLDAMEKFIRDRRAEKLVAVESRGFIFGGALARQMDLSVVLARKPGKLPGATVSAEYELEYGTDCLEMHADAIAPGERIVIVDDLIATGGTLQAVCGMVEKLGGEVVGVSAVIELSFLPWREKLPGYDVNYLISYDSE